MTSLPRFPPRPLGARLALGVVLLAGCARSERARPPRTSAESSSVSSVVPLTPAPRDTALAALRAYHLSMEGLHKWVDAQHRLNALTQRHPELAREMAAKGAPRSLGDMIARIDATVPIHDSIARAGLTTRDYVFTMLSLQAAMVQYAMKQRGPLNPPPTGALADNIEFVGANLPTIRALLDSAKPSTPEP